jgi:hypothetical protein
LFGAGAAAVVQALLLVGLDLSLVLGLLLHGLARSLTLALAAHLAWAHAAARTARKCGCSA